jgi:hypothetical protein
MERLNDRRERASGGDDEGTTPGEMGPGVCAVRTTYYYCVLRKCGQAKYGVYLLLRDKYLV